MARKKGAQFQRLNKPTRPGEGFAVDLFGRSEVKGGTVSFGIDLTNAPVPDRRYVAHVAAVIEADDIVRLIFGQTRVDGTLRSLLDVAVSKRGVRQFVASMDGLSENVAHLARQGIVAKPLRPPPTEPDQAVGLAANVIAAAFSDDEACLDLYEVSSFSIAKAVHGGGSVHADPVVRVTLPTAVLLGVYEKLGTVRNSLAMLEEKT